MHLESHSQWQPDHMGGGGWNTYTPSHVAPPHTHAQWSCAIVNLGFSGWKVIRAIIFCGMAYIGNSRNFGANRLEKLKKIKLFKNTYFLCFSRVNVPLLLDLKHCQHHFHRFPAGSHSNFTMEFQH